MTHVKLARFMSIVPLIAAMATVGIASAIDSPTAAQTGRPEILEVVDRHDSGDRADEPGGAAEYYLLKRRGPTPDHDRIQALQAARRHIDRMPTHSITLQSFAAAILAGFWSGTPNWPALRTLGGWEPLGPGNIGGRTRSLIIHPTNPDIMYTGGVSGGVWKTTDGGQIWWPLADLISNIAINSMAMDPSDPDTLYAGTGEGYFREEVRGTWLPLRGAGIYKTTNGGASWQLLQATDNEDFHWVNDLVTSPNHPARVYAATRTGVWLSDNRGADWARLLESEENGGCLDLALVTDLPNDRLFAACGTLGQATVYRRVMTDSGVWQPILSEPGMGRTTLAIAPSSRNIVYALSASNLSGPSGNYEQGLHALYRSDLNGDPGSWQVQVDNTDPIKLHTLLLTNPAAASYLDCGWSNENRWINMGWYANVVAVDPIDPDVVWAAGVDLFRSDDGGRSWGLASYWWMDRDDPQFVHADQHAIVFHPDYDGAGNRTLYAANDGGIFITLDSSSPVARGPDAICDPGESQMPWGSLNHNLGITQFYHGAVFPGAQRFIGGTQDNGTLLLTEGAGHDDWLHVIGGDGGYVAINPVDPSIVYGESQRANIRKSTDGGLHFSGVSAGIPASTEEFLFITPFVMDPNEPRRLWMGGHRLWRTDNSAGFWRAASQTLSSTGWVSALAVHPSTSDTVVVGTSEGFIHISHDATASDQSTAWPSVRPRGGFVSWIAFDPQDPETLYATYAGFGGEHVWRSRDGGEAWQALTGSGTARLPDIPVHSLVVDPGDSRLLYIGTDLGVFTSVNGGATWAVENTGFANAVTEALTLARDDDDRPWLFAFTHGRGAWRVPLLAVPPAPRAGGRRVTP